MESRRSFVSRMNPCGLSAEKGCYIFAMINMVVISTCLLACVYYVKWAWDHLSGGFWGVGSGAELLFSQLLAFLVTTSFVFAVLLCFGVHKKRPKYIYAYFIYGFIEKIIFYLLILVLIILLSPGFIQPELRNWLITVLVINVIYSTLLVTVYRAHSAMSSDATDTYKMMEDVPLA